MHVRALLLLLALTLEDCSVSGVVTDWASEDVAGPEPVNYLREVAVQLDGVIGPKDRDLRVLEISRPRRVDLLKGASWLVCLKSDRTSSRLPPAYYGVIIQRNKIVESRISVLTDECETQPYTPFNWSVEATRPAAQ
jgi:hypothetical protein